MSPQPSVAAGRLAALLGAWANSGPLNERLARGLRNLILDGRLPLQTRLAPERALAEALGVSRNTVTAAYRRLRDEGYLTARQGSGTFTTLPVGHDFHGDITVPAGVRFDLTVATLPAPPCLPDAVIAASQQLHPWLDHHGYHPLGLPPLRAALAAGYTARGLVTGPEQILVTSGALHGLHLVAATLVAARDHVAVEIPTYPAAIDLFRARRARLIAIPVNTAGWDLDHLRGKLQQSRPTLAYLIPDYHNPTGALMDAGTRRQVALAAARAGSYLVADETSVDLQLHPSTPPGPLTSALPAHSLHIGSMSKGYWGGLRVGWVRADTTVIGRLARARTITDMASPVLDQLVSLHLLDNAATILEDRRRLAQQRQAVLLNALHRHLPDWQATPASGGLSAWVKLPKPCASTLAAQALDNSVAIIPGPRYAPIPGALQHFLSLPHTLPAPVLEHAIDALASVDRPHTGI